MAGPEARAEGRRDADEAVKPEGAGGRNSGGKRVRPYIWALRGLNALGARTWRSSGALGILGLLGILFALGLQFWSTTDPLRSNGLLDTKRLLKQGFQFQGACGEGVNASVAQESMVLAAHFLLYSQHKDGNFIDLYNKEKRRSGSNDNAESQTDALWSLCVWYRQVRLKPMGYPKGIQTRIHEAVLLAVSYLDQHSRRTSSGARFLLLPGQNYGRLSMMSQFILSHVELLRTLSDGPMPKKVGLNAAKFEQTSQAWTLNRNLKDYVEHFLRLRLPNGRFIRTYEANGKPRKQHSAKMHEAFSEGLALLALVSVAKYGNRPELWPLAVRSRDAMMEAYDPSFLDSLQPNGGGSKKKQHNAGFDHPTVQFFWAGGLALVEMADVMDGSKFPHESAEEDGEAAKSAKMLLELAWKIQSTVGHGLKGGADEETMVARPQNRPVAAMVAAHWVARMLSKGAGATSRGDAADLEGQWAHIFGCWVAKSVASQVPLQVGGPLSSPSSARMPNPKHGYSPLLNPTFKFNITQCKEHVTKLLSGSIQAKKDKIVERATEERLAAHKRSQVTLTPGKPISIADMIAKSGEGSKPTASKPKELSECERAKHAHDRCTNDNPTGGRGFTNCCRALAGYLFACEDDPSFLPEHIRSLYVPSYTALCVKDGHAPLPEGYGVERMGVRYSEFPERKKEAEGQGCDLASIGGVMITKGGDELRLAVVNSFLTSWSQLSIFMLAH